MTLRFDDNDFKSYTFSFLQFSLSRLSLLAVVCHQYDWEMCSSRCLKENDEIRHLHDAAFPTESHWDKSGKKQCFLDENKKNLTGPNILKSRYDIYGDN